MDLRYSIWVLLKSIISVKDLPDWISNMIFSCVVEVSKERVKVLYINVYISPKTDRVFLGICDLQGKN